jgi:hypothetical protein
MSLVFVGLAILIVFIVPLIFQFLWNITVPEIFGLMKNKILAGFPSASDGKYGFWSGQLYSFQ